MKRQRPPQNWTRVEALGGSDKSPKHFSQILYKFLLRRIIVENYLPFGFYKAMLLIFYCICLLIFFLSNSNIKMSGFSSYMLLNSVAAYLGLIWVLSLLLLFDVGSPQKKTIQMIVLNYMTIGYTYIVFPFCIWSFSQLMSHPQTGVDTSFSNPSNLTIMIFLCLGLIYNLAYLASRNTLFCRSPNCTTNHFVEPVAYLLITTCLICASLENSPFLSTSLKMQLTIVEIVLLTLSLGSLITNGIYHRPSLNAVYTSGYILCYLFTLANAIDLYVENRVGHRQHTSSVFIYIIVYPFLYRLFNSIYYRKEKILITRGKILGSKDYRAITKMHHWLSHELITLTCSLDREIYTHYRGVLDHLLLQHCSSRHTAYSYRLTLDELNEAMITIIKNFDDNYYKSKALLRLKALKDIVNVQEVRNHLKNFSKHPYEAFVLKFVFEFIMRSAYNGTSKDEESSATFECIFDDMWIDNIEEGQHHADKLDFLQIFRDMDSHTKVTQCIKQGLTEKIKTFDMLLFESTVSQKALLGINQLTLKSHMKILKHYERMNFGTRDHSTYIYPMFIYYFSLVRNSIRKSEYLFQIYKKKLTVIANSYANKFKDKSSDVFDSNSITMQLSLDKDNPGRILNITTNYFEFIGKCPSGSPIGHNLNSILPGSYGLVHTELMRNYPKYQIFHRNFRDVYINGFDGFLRNIKARVKIVPSIQEPPSGCVLEVFPPYSGTSLVLLEEDFRIVNAEREFWDNFDRQKLKEEAQDSLQSISRDACIAIDLLQCFQNAKQRIRNAACSETDYGTLIKKVLTCLTDLETANATLGVSYLIERLEGQETKSKKRYLNMNVISHVKGASGFTKVRIGFSGPASRRANRLVTSYSESMNSELEEDSSKQEKSNVRDSTLQSDFEFNSKQHFKSIISPCLNELDNFVQKHASLIQNLRAAHQLEESQWCSLEGSKDVWTIIELLYHYLQNNKVSLGSPLFNTAEGVRRAYSNADTNIASPFKSVKNDQLALKSDKELSQGTHGFGGSRVQGVQNLIYNFSTAIAREANRKQEVTKQDQTNEIVMASSNLIGRIMNKISKKETVQLSKSVDGGRETINSSVNSSKVHSVHHMLKRAEQEIKGTRTLKESVYLALIRVVGLVSVVSIIMILSNISKTYISTNLQGFRDTNSMIKVDFYLRKNLNLILEEIVLGWELLAPDFYSTDGLPEAMIDSLLANQKPRHANMKQALGTNNIMELISVKRSYGVAVFIDELEKFQTSSFSGESKGSAVGELLKKKVTISKMSLESPEGDPPFSELNPVAFLRIFTIRIGRTKWFVDKGKPFMHGKDPLWRFPSDFILQWYLYIIDLIGATYNAENGPTKAFELALIQQTKTITEDLPREHSLSLILLIILFGIAVVGYIAAFVWVSLRINRRLTSLILMYNQLRHEELEIHPIYYRKCLEHVEKYKFNESKLIGSYVNINNSRSTQVLPIKGKKLNIAKGSRKHARYLRDYVFVGTRTLLTGLVAMVVLLVAFFWLVLASNYALDSSIAIQKFYFNNHINFIKLSNHYEAFHLMLAYGNFIKMDGQYTEDSLDQSAITDFTKYWIQQLPTLSAYIGESDAAILRQMLFEEFCKHIPQSSVGYESDLFVCQRHIPCQKGVLGFFLDESEKILVKSADVKANYRQHLETTKTNLAEGPHLDYLTSVDNVRMRAIHDIIIETLTAKLFEIIDGALQDNIAQVHSDLKRYEITFIVLLIVAALLTTIVSKVILNRDQRACAETSITILPEVYYQNAYLRKTLQSQFFIQK